jgi:ribosome maturation protein Sdo1
MSASPPAPVSKRAQRIHDAVLEVDGVVAVRVWELTDRVEIGVVVSHASSATDVLRRVSEVTDAMRAPDESWDVGLLTES